MAVISVKLFYHCSRKITLFPFVMKITDSNSKSKISNNSNCFLDNIWKYCASFPSKLCNNFAFEISICIHTRHVLSRLFKTEVRQTEIVCPFLLFPSNCKVLKPEILLYLFIFFWFALSKDLDQYSHFKVRLV